MTRLSCSLRSGTALGLSAFTLVALCLAAIPAAHAQSYALQTIATFNGTGDSVPNGSLINIDNTLYGTTQTGGGFGSVFSVSASGGPVTDLTTFDYSNGESPDSGLADVDGTLFGTTASGGASGFGTVFSVSASGGPVTDVVSFDGSSAGNNGDYPIGGVIDVDGTLYGTTYYGGANNAGTVYSESASGGPVTTLASFGGTFGNGSNPIGGLVDINGTLYGTTQNGGYYNNGSVFSISASGGTATTLASFNGFGGTGSPNGGLVNVGGILYGTTSSGGANGDGNVFSVNPSSGPFAPITDVADFNGANGISPNGSLINVGGTLYGTTTNSANGNYANGPGLVFALAPVGMTQATAIVPAAGQTTTNPDGTVTYTFNNIASGTWVDPLSGGYLYDIALGSPLFSDITLPTGLQSDFYTVTDDGMSQQYAPGASVSFGGSGVDQFEITGVDPGTGALPVQFFFANGQSGSFNQTSLIPAASAVPEPSSFALLGLAAPALGLMARRARRKAGASA